MHRVPRSSKRGFFRTGYAVARNETRKRSPLRFETGIDIEEVIEDIEERVGLDI